jgi:hypothetical protein
VLGIQKQRPPGKPLQGAERLHLPYPPDLGRLGGRKRVHGKLAHKFRLLLGEEQGEDLAEEFRGRDPLREPVQPLHQ